MYVTLQYYVTIIVSRTCDMLLNLMFVSSSNVLIAHNMNWESMYLICLVIAHVNKTQTQLRLTSEKYHRTDLSM